MTPPDPFVVAPEIHAYYDEDQEDTRLRDDAPHHRLELLRTQEILRRNLPPAPARILDVGGGTGVHAEWLTADGHTVHVVDPVPLHVERARHVPGVTAELGDARALEAEASTYDVVLLLGPLYHLLDRAERVTAWREAARVVRPGGLVAGAAISRWASWHDIFRLRIEDADFRRYVDGALRDGVHAPEPGRPFFTTAYFHRPEDLVAEAREAGLDVAPALAVEGSLWLLRDLGDWLDDGLRQEMLLERVRRVESEPSLLGASSHLLALARRPHRG